MMHAKAVRGALCLAIFTGMIGLGALGVWAPTPASAQAIPKSL